jgi:cation/acetate symporter
VSVPVLLLLQAAPPASSIGQRNSVAIACFFLFIAITLGITWWAARRTRTTEEFYAAGRTISPGQNGLALAGDYMSAASFLGIAGLVSTTGFDGLIYSTGWLVGWPIVLFLIAEPLRNLGKYTFADVVALNRRPGPVRLAAALGTLATVVFYLIAQMVGAGSLIKLMFGISYETAVVLVGLAMIIYVLFGGMLATTWVQIVKAVLLLAGAALLAILVLSRFGMNPLNLFQAAADKYGAGVLSPGRLVAKPLDAISLGMALMFGTAGLPHILMRFYTVPDATAARRSVFYATGLIGVFYLMTFILGFGAMVLVGSEAITAVDKGGNMAAPLLAELLGGVEFLGFIAAVAFATILAVVAGLTLSGAAALSHDIWVSVVKKGKATAGEQLRVAKIATLCLGAVAVALGITFKGQNVAFMVSLAFAIAASANFPALILTVFWRKSTGSGVVASMVTGTVTTLALIYLSPTIQVDILKHESAIFPLKNPALITIPLSFLVGIVTSLLTGQHDTESRFDARSHRMHLGEETGTGRPSGESQENPEVA